jgi:ferredoxin
MTLIARIDDRACLAHGDCATVAPDAFRVDDVAVTVPSTDGRLRATALACAAGAVQLFDPPMRHDIDR